MDANKNRAQVFFDKHVLPNVEEWRKNPLDERLAMNAVVSLYHLADYYWHVNSPIDTNLVYGQTKTSLYRKELGIREPNYGILRDVAEAHKHMKLKRPKKVVTSATQTQPGQPGYNEAAEYGVTEYNAGEALVVELDSRGKCQLSGIIEYVTEMWGKKLNKRGR